MKKAIVLSVLGVAATALTSYGQGVIQFNNYISSTYQQVFWGSNVGAAGLTPGAAITDANVELQLFYAVGTFTNPTTFMSAATAGITTFINPAITYAGGGYYNGANQTLVGWNASTAPDVTFMVQAWETTGTYGGADYASSMLRGSSALWTETTAATSGSNGIQPVANPATGFAAGPPAMNVSIVPEPTTMAFAGMGLLSLLTFVRRKKV